MSLNGSGLYLVNSSGQPVVAATTITSAAFNAFTSDIATALSTAIFKDGQQTVTANIPMGAFKFTGLGAGSANGQSLRYEQLFTTSAVTLLGSLDQVKGADIASAGTVNLTTATGNAVHITGTTTITAVTLGSGMWRLVIFDGILTLTHHATNNNLPSAANITTAAGDRALYWADGTTVYCIAYERASGQSLIAVPFIDTNPVVVGSSDGTKKVRFEVDGLTTATTRVVTVPDKDFTIADTTLYALLASPTFTGTVTTAALTAAGALTASGALAGTISDPGSLFGLTTANNAGDATNDIDIAVGEATSVHATPASRLRMVLASALTKRLDASWVTGTNQGGLSSSLTIANTTYHVHLIRVAGVDDVGFDTSAVAANLITDHSATAYRRIGSILRESGAIVAFVQFGDWFGRSSPLLDISDASPGTSAVTRTMTAPVGIVTTLLMNIGSGAAGTNGVYLSALDATDLAPSATLAPLTTSQCNISGGANGTPSSIGIVKTNTSAQIRSRSIANISLLLSTMGWWDSRGRNA